MKKKSRQTKKNYLCFKKFENKKGKWKPYFVYRHCWPTAQSSNNIV